jgi:hypothetical protein
MASRQPRPMTYIATMEQLARAELLTSSLRCQSDIAARLHQGPTTRTRTCATRSGLVCDKSTLTGCSIKGDRPRFGGYLHEDRASSLRELAEADESCSTCVVASADGKVRKRAPWTICVQNEERTDCCTLNIASSRHASRASLAVTDRDIVTDGGVTSF